MATLLRATLICALESYRWTHTYIDGCWYSSVSTDWTAWNSCRAQPMVLRTYCGRADKFHAAV